MAKLRLQLRRALLAPLLHLMLHRALVLGGDQDVSSEEDGVGWDDAPDLDRELLEALRQCVELYGAPRPTGPGPGPGPREDLDLPWRRRHGVQCQQRVRWRRHALDGSGRPWLASGGRLSGTGRGRTSTSPFSSSYATGVWVTYYGLHQPVPVPGAQRRPGRGRERQGDVAACVLHCAFAKTELVSEAGLPDEARVVKRLEDSVRRPRPRLAAMRRAHECFVRLGSVSDVDDDPCYYTLKFAKCMDMGILKEFYKMKNNSDF